MKCFATACAVLLMTAAVAAAGEQAVSEGTLADMGLGGMARMSDDQGLAVRGKGASVWGGSTASWAIPSQQNGPFTPFGPSQNGAHSENYYQASGPSTAAGGSLSFAGQVGVQYAADPTGFTLGVSAHLGIAGGAAFAFSM